MVADFIGFSDARPNYAALIEIPLRLREHATAQRAAVAEPQAALADIERRAMLERASTPRRRCWPRRATSWPSSTTPWSKKQRRAAQARRDAQRAGRRRTQSGLQRGAGDHRRRRQQGRLGAPCIAEARRTPTTADEADRSRAGGDRCEDCQGRSRDRRPAPHGAGAFPPPARGRAGARPFPQRPATIIRKPPSTTTAPSPMRSGTCWRAWSAAACCGISCARATGHDPRAAARTSARPSFPFPFPLPGGRRASDSRGGDWREPSSRGGWSPGRGSRSDDDDFTTGGSF